MSNFTTKQGLKELPIDNRDFPLGGVFGFIDISEVPKDDFIVTTPFAIKNQGDSDLCSAFAVTAVSEDQEGIELLPEYQFFSTKRITGEKEEWGADLRSACKSAVKYGSVPVSKYGDMKGMPRGYILDERNWPSDIDTFAQLHKKETYFAVTGQYDAFDNIRCALWQHRDNKSSIVTGAVWKNGWLDQSYNGVIPDIAGDGFGHAFKIFGQKIINGEPHLIAQLSNGNEIGDRGYFYFNRTITNRELTKYGLFMFKDISREDAEYYLAQPFHINTPWFVVLWKFITSHVK